MAQLWRVVDGWLLENVTKLPMMKAPLTSEDDERHAQPSSYSSHLHQTQTEGNTEVEAPANNPSTHIYSETDGEDCGGPELTSSPDQSSYLQPNSDRKASGSSEINHLSHFGPEMRDSDEGWDDSRAHGSGVNTAKKSLSCSECDEEFHDQRSLQRHLTQHSGKKSSSCKKSQKSSKVTQNVNLQKGVQTRKSKVKCDVCEKIYQRTYLRTHMRMHTGEKPFGCDECGQRFLQKHGLSQHMIIHTGGESFPCDECGRRFRRKSDLNRHIKFHTGEKPFKCDECGHRFTLVSDLNLHMRIHTGEKPFSCKVCGKLFMWHKSAQDHMRQSTVSGFCI